MENERFLEDWKTLLRFKSISTDPQYEEECGRCAAWLVQYLSKMGLKAELLPTSRKPVVFGTLAQPGAKRTVLLYGHYDVQPVDPVELWRHDPFEPTIEGDRLYARGAQDNKGQLMYQLKALQTLIEAKQLSCNVKVVIEGEEEDGSFGLTEMLPQWRDRLKADTLLVCDSGAPKAGMGAITMGMRGIVHLTVALGGLKKDLHSGMHGGIVKNPATEMARLIATLHDKDGRIAVKGFYDGVTEPSGEVMRLADAFPFPWEQYEALIGAPPVGGEAGLSPAVRNGFRPTIELNGIHSGYGGAGSKTIIPSHALAKISARLVAGQEPKAALRKIEEHLHAHAPQGLKLEITEQTVGGPALMADLKSQSVQSAREALRSVTGVEPVLYWMGASIPVVADLARCAGAEPLIGGFGLEEDNIHAPNESFSLGQFRLGYQFVCKLLSQI